MTITAESLLALWHICDGEEHWVAAANPMEAKRILCESIGFTLEELEEEQPTVVAVNPTEKVKVRVAYGEAPKWAPKNSTCYVEATAWDWCRDGAKLIATTLD